jgi:hypothetical protein
MCTSPVRHRTEDLVTNPCTASRTSPRLLEHGVWAMLHKSRLLAVVHVKDGTSTFSLPKISWMVTMFLATSTGDENQLHERGLHQAFPSSSSPLQINLRALDHQFDPRLVVRITIS